MSKSIERSLLSRWIYRLKCLPGKNFYASIGRQRDALGEWMAQTKPDVILAQFGTTGLGILPVAKELGIPVVVHFHGFDLSSALRDRWYRWSLLTHIHEFSSIIVVGQHQRKWMSEHGVDMDKVHLIPCGVPTEEYRPGKGKKNSEIIRFLVVSRLVEKKGIEFTIRAFEILKKNHPQSELRIFGDGPLEGSLRRLVDKLDLGHSVKFEGSIPPDQVKEEMEAADVFLQHSIEASNGDLEGFPISIAEASASGLPVVCSNAKGIIDQVIEGETGYLVEQKDFRGMAEKMIQLASNPAVRSKMGSEGRNRMVKYFDTARQIKDLEKVLMETCNRRIL